MSVSVAATAKFTMFPYFNFPSQIENKLNITSCGDIDKMKRIRMAFIKT